MTSIRRNRGAVLIVVLGVLAVLALLGVSFANLQAMERQVSRNYLDTVRARLLAQSGIQDAEARLKVYFPARATDPGPKPWKYWGSDPTETNEPGTAANPFVPLQKALNPSFAWEDEAIQNPMDANVKPRKIMIDGKPRGFSGAMKTGTYGLFGDHYALKIRDLSGCIYVNDGIAGGSKGSVSQNLKRILNVLGATPTVKIPQLGDLILSRRPPGGYRSVGDLQAALGDDPATFDRVREYLTVNAWVDRNVANPVPLSAATESRYPVKYSRGTPPLYRMGKSKDAFGVVIPGELNTCPPANPNDASIRVYGLDSLNPQWIEIVGRAPVNVNSAPREVLVALLTDLKGFFLTDRRRNNPAWSGGPYLCFSQKCLFSPAGSEGSEYGFLVETLPFVGPGSTVAGGISAFEVADELIACRNRTVTKYFNYATVPWSGPFGTWRQFNLFADNLITIGLLKDDRAIFVDYDENNVDKTGTGFGNTVPSPLQRRHAAQALADVLKANFNPNLHLNELNPDENLYQVVDKTDLIVNSTEFTFLPYGYFEIESLGRVLRPKPDFADCLLSPDNELVGQAKVIAVVKLYDLYRETSFKDFYAGTLPPRTGGFDTSNDRSLEIGPEPDNGVFPGNLGDTKNKPDNEWDGYLAFPTVGGPCHAGGGAHPKNTLQRTLEMPGSPQFADAFHSHFSLDFDCHYHTLGPGARAEIASRTLPGETVKNYPDALPDGSETPYPGPYAPSSGAGNVHRLARSFRLETADSGTVVTPTLKPYAPSDLRVDGGYSERHSAPAYFTSYEGTPLWNFDKETATGMVSYWFKPSYAPERTGKIRYLWDYSRYHDPCSQNCHVFPFALWFFPTQYKPAVSESTVPFYGWGNETIGKFRPCSLVFGHCSWHDLPSMSWFGSVTESLNHIGHPDEALKPTTFKAHRWMQLTYQWHLYDPNESENKSSKLLLNGSTTQVPFTWNTLRPSDPTGYGPIMWKWNNHDGGDSNHMRLGGPSQIGTAPGTPYRGNYASDGTYDEFFVWRTDTDTDPMTLWQRGRYYVPFNTTSGEGRFTSQALTFRAGATRSLPPPSGLATPGGGGSGTTTASPTGAPSVPGSIRVLGLSWTWYGESTNPLTNKPVLYEFLPGGIPGKDLEPQVSLGFLDGNVGYGPYDNDVYSAVQNPDGSTPVLQSPDQARYFAQFRLRQAGLASILLATPVLDDITIYWDDSQTHLISYYCDNRSF